MNSASAAFTMLAAVVHQEHGVHDASSDETTP